MGRPGIAAARRRRRRCPPAGAKGGKGTVWFPCPLLTPPNPPSSRSAKHSRLNGGYGGSVPCVEQILGRCKTLNFPCVIRRAQQCAARQCRAAAFCCEKLRFHQGCTLGAPDVPVGPSHFAARPKGVAAQRKVRGVKRGQETIRCPVPFCLRRQTAAIFPPPWARRFLRRQTAASPCRLRRQFL